MALPDSYVFYQTYVEERLATILDELPVGEALRRAAGYSLMAGGKRIRPVLLLTMYSSLTKRLTCCTCPTASDMDHVDPNPLHAACALEMVHTYSLIHDDLPAMDDDDLRRGRPTLHRVAGEAMAIMAGDALLTTSSLVLAQRYGRHPELATTLTALLSHAALRMVEGQVMDTIPATDKPRTVEYLGTLVDNKTGALLTAALSMAGAIAHSGATTLGHLDDLGRYLGQLFQITDDILDVTGEAGRLGKTPGKDAAQEKLTFVTLLGLQGARERASKTRDAALSILPKLDIDPRFFLGLINFIHDRSY